MSLAMAYLTFYVANLPLQVSGVTAVVVLGLYGSATGKWMMCASILSGSLSGRNLNSIAVVFLTRKR